MVEVPDTNANGWTPVPRSMDRLLAHVNAADTKPYGPQDFGEAGGLGEPKSGLAVNAKQHASEELPRQTYNHSMRVFYYGMALLHNHGIPGVSRPPPPGLVETFYLACMLHDVGTAPETIGATRLSFELWGAIEAPRLVQLWEGSKDQAELVAEAVSRHQDLGETGMVPAVLGLLYFGTLFDNVGLYEHVVHPTTIQSVTSQYPRDSWSGCFANTIREEMRLKPWAHSTVIDKFAEKVEGNKLMAPFDTPRRAH